jgi:hypothetical protein
MTTPVRQLIYRSRSLLGGGARETGLALGHILEQSRSRNAAAGLTGALMLQESWFVQLLEGEAAAVEAVFARIRCDSRHSDVQITTDNPTATRIFADWSMAYAGPDGLPDIPLTFTMGGEITLAQLRALAHLRALAR